MERASQPSLTDTAALHGVAAPGAPASGPLLSEDGDAFLRLRTAFEAARQDGSEACVDSHYHFAGRSVHLRVVGRRLAGHVHGPFAHLAFAGSPGHPARLRIDLWDEAATGIPCPLPSLGEGSEARPLVTASPDGRFVGHRRRGAVTWLDRETRHIIGCVASSDRLALHERSKPLLYLLSLWHADEGGQVVHAGLVGRNGHGALCVGPAGAGKSTVALACAGVGFDYLGDDCIGLYRGADGAFLGHSLYGSAQLDPGHLERFPRLAAHAIRGDGPREAKAVLLLGELPQVRLAGSVPIRALALPRVTDRSASELHPATKGEALLALAPSSLLAFPGQGPRALKRLRWLVERLPAYWLLLGPDLREIPQRMADLLAEVGQP